MSNFFETTGPTQEENLFKAMNSYYPTTGAEGFGASMKMGIRNNITGMTIDKVQSVLGNFDDHLDEELTPDQANEEFDPITPFDQKVRRVDARIRTDREKFLFQQQAIIKQSEISPGLSLAGQFTGGMMDPAMWAATSVTLGAAAGVLNASRAGAFVKLSRAVDALPKLKKGQLLAAELAENVAVAALVEIPLAESLENVYDQKFSNKEHAFNIAVGTISGTFFRYLGRAFTNLKNKPSSVDQKITGNVVKQELLDAETQGRVPDFDKAAENHRSNIATEVNDLQTQVRTAEAFGDSGADSVYYSTAPVGAQKLSEAQIRMGTSLGEGLYMTKSPALAEQKGLHLPEAEIHKFDLNELNLLDIDHVDEGNAKLFQDFKEFIAKSIPLPIKKLKEISEMPNFKQILKVIDDLEEMSPDSVIQNRVNSFFMEKGIDGYKFQEDFFNGEPVGDAVFVMRASEKFDKSFIETKTSDASNRAASKLPEEPAETPDVDMTPERVMEFMDDDPFYRNDPEILKMLKDSEDPELKALAETSVESIEKEIDSMFEETQAMMKMEKDEQTRLLENEVKDVKEKERKEKLLEEKISKFEESKAQAVDAENMLKDAEICNKVRIVNNRNK